MAFALGHPGFVPTRIPAELKREKWGGFVVPANGLHRVLSRRGLGTRAKRRWLIAGYAAPRSPGGPNPSPNGTVNRPAFTGGWVR